MASTSSINSSSSGSQAPNPPPRTHSRPNQPPPPPPLPTVPPVPPTRDSSIAISKTITVKHTPPVGGAPNLAACNNNVGDANGAKFLSQFEPLFKPLTELPPPDPFMNKPKAYSSQRTQQKQSIAPKIQSC